MEGNQNPGSFNTFAAGYSDTERVILLRQYTEALITWRRVTELAKQGVPAVVQPGEQPTQNDKTPGSTIYFPQP